MFTINPSKTRMKTSKNLLCLLLITVPGLVLGMSASPPAAAVVSSGTQHSGTYFFESVTQSTGQSLNGFLSLHKGGTATWADQSDFGAAGNLNSTTHGTWERTGPDEVTVEGYYYRFDAVGIPVLLIRITLVGSPGTGTGSGSVDVFGPNQNPVTELPMIPNADTIAVTSFRLN